MLKHVDGNLLTLAEAGDFDVVIQGCNCFCAMGGGIAREIRERYPHVAEADAQTGLGDYNKLGNYSKAIVKGEDEHSFIIINAYTQYNMSTGDDVFEYVAFALILQKIERLYGNYSIGLPYIGMGLARGNSSIIMEMIEEFAYAVEKKGGSVTLVQFV
jgi:O-acetyl-ADP-ribose deacetylase (regulator of RNase III)